MIHCGSIVGAAVSQGRSVAFKYFDTSWTKFQDLRNDRSKRDFITYGAAAGVASAFSAPIGGIMFTLEEGASFWSTSLTFRAFFCALVTQLVLNLFTSFQESKKGTIINEKMFEFGDFSSFPGYYPYELIIFMLMGAGGGVIGSLFVHINEKITVWRMEKLDTDFKKILELLMLTFVWTSVSFVLPLIDTTCSPIPTNTASWSNYQYDLLSRLEKFNCPDNSYNQFASLFLTDSTTVLEELFHFPEENGDESFSTAILLVFFIFYFLFAAYTSGTFAPAGLFIPTLVAGSAFGRIIGHLVNIAYPDSFSAPGIYALIGASAILGGMSRMTIAGTI
jgi:H+/Cl- antiporter ClcA